MLPKTATSSGCIAEIGIDYMSAKPKTATHQETLPFSTTLAEARLEPLPKTASIVTDKRCDAVFGISFLRLRLGLVAEGSDCLSHRSRRFNFQDFAIAALVAADGATIELLTLIS